MATTLIDALEDVSTLSSDGYTFLDNALQPSTWPFSKLVFEARRRGAALRARGLNKGDRLALIIPEPEDFVLTFLGAVTAGIVPVPMYPPLALGRLDSYVQSAAAILGASGARAIATTRQIAPILWSLTGKVASLEDLILAHEVAAEAAQIADVEPVAIAPDDTCFLQFTSGSTAAPKGVIVTHRNLTANGKAIILDGLRSDPARDRGVSWLPLYHDMGLIGFVVAPLYNRIPVVFIPTLAFVKRPAVWMETVHKYRGTITFGPNFAYGLAAKRARSGAQKNGQPTLDLSCVRVLGCGAEPINAATMRTFVEAFKPMGLDENALMPCYGMAEATLAMAFDDLSRPFRAIAIDRAAYETEAVARPVDGTVTGGGVAKPIELVACGQTFPGHELAVMDDDGRPLAEGRVGEIVFRGPSVTPGYFENPEASRALLRDGWLHTGDLGFLLDGQIYISGRQKDLIILNGRNYHPQAIEWVVERVEGVRRGNVVAFSVAGDETERLVIVAESTVASGPEDRAQATREAVAREVKSELGIAAAEVVLVPKGAMPKTSSGKLQRTKTRAQYQDGTLGREGTRALGSTATRVSLFRHITVSAFARIRHRLKRALPRQVLAAAEVLLSSTGGGRGTAPERRAPGEKRD